MKPLANRTVLLACSEKKMTELAAGIEALGGRVFPLPVIELREIEDKRLLDKALASLGAYSWILFTSAYAVRFFMKRMEELEIPRPDPMPKICAIGPATAREIEERGFEVALVPEYHVAEGIIECLRSLSGDLRSLAGQRILLPRALEAREVLPESLAAAGALVDVIPSYRNVRADIDDHRLRHLKATRPDIIVFTSSSTVRNLVDILGPEDGKKMLQESIVAVLGPITRSTAESFSKSPEIVPKESTIASLLEAISSYSSVHFSIDSRQ